MSESSGDSSESVDRQRLKPHTHARFIELHSHEDNLLSTRFYTFLFASSFLTVAWVEAGDQWVRLMIALVGIILTLTLWRTIRAAAQVAGDVRHLALKVESDLYGRKAYAPGPLGRMHRRTLARRRKAQRGGRISKSVDWMFHLGRIGAPNTLTALIIPLFVLMAWVAAAIASLFVPAGSISTREILFFI